MNLVDVLCNNRMQLLLKCQLVSERYAEFKDIPRQLSKKPVMKRSQRYSDNNNDLGF